MGYRPEVICILIDSGSDEILFVKHRAIAEIQGFPQEGISLKENIEEAAIRCMFTELGITESQIQFRKSAWLGKRKLPENRWDERDLDIHFRRFLGLPNMIGKGYYGALLYLAPGVDIMPNKAEVKEIIWSKSKELQILHEKIDNTKRKILELAISEFLE